MNNNECFSADYSYFFNIWPWMGLGAAVVVLILLFFTDWLRGDTTKSRWKDPFWLGWTFIVCFGKGGMPRRVCWWNIGIGLFYHIVMFGSIMPQVFSGNINMPLLTIIMGIDMVITFILWLALQKHAMKRS